MWTADFKSCWRKIEAAAQVGAGVEWPNDPRQSISQVSQSILSLAGNNPPRNSI